VVALLDDPAVVKDDELIHSHDGAQPMSHQGGAAVHELPQSLLDEDLAFRVQRAGGLVEQQDRRVAQDGAGERDPLALAAGQLDPAFPDHGVEPVEQDFSELGDVCRLCGAVNLGAPAWASSPA
jgi:uncharacterized membrane protein YccC